MPFRGLFLGEFNYWRKLVLPLAVAAVALAVAIIGASIVGAGGTDSINFFVDRLSGESGTWLGGLVGASSLIALSVGMVSAVNPCGFAMLPTYLGLYLGDNRAEEEGQKPVKRVRRALKVGGAVTAGFVLLFGIAGTAIGLGASFVGDVIPWLGLAMGVGLVFIGAWMVSGGELSSGLAARVANRMGNPNQVNTKGYFMFGLSYGTASLSCTITPFLLVLGIGVTGFSLTVVGNFFLFALGMGLVIMALTVGMAIFKGAMVTLLRKALPYIHPFSSAFMVVAGAYIVFYWLSIGHGVLTN